MSKIKTLLSETQRRVRDEGILGFRWPAWMIYDKIFIQNISSDKFGYQGKNIFEREWDVLILLDACRADLMESISHPILSGASSTDTVWSIAPHSNHFLQRTFTTEYAGELRDTIYVTANPQTDEKLENGLLDEVDEVWRYSWDKNKGTVPARAVTDRAILAWQNIKPERLLVHYMQPHFPSVPYPELGSQIDLDHETKWPDPIWERLRKGLVSHSEVWEAYRANLLYVLDDVELLLSSIDTDCVIISSDHGNAMGERGFYGHGNWPVPEVWKVPWIETTATNSSAYIPGTHKTAECSDDSSLEEKLSALGYKE